MFDPLRRLQGGDDTAEIEDRDRLWVAVDGMGGDHAPGPVLEGCLQAIERLPLRIRFIGETDRVLAAAAALQLGDQVNAAVSAGHLDLVASGPRSRWGKRPQRCDASATPASMWQWIW